MTEAVGWEGEGIYDLFGLWVGSSDPIIQGDISFPGGIPY